ncbi:hypothetical protein F5X98DRAFT_219950 [Xylaria grammica]|nr:hypothetical protein F5X98DRAFT_219950 [Xylaria grammica]
MVSLAPSTQSLVSDTERDVMKPVASSPASAPQESPTASSISSPAMPRSTSSPVGGIGLVYSDYADVVGYLALIGLLMGISLLGLAVGPLIGGAFTSYTTWRWRFYVNLPAGGLAAIAIALLRLHGEAEKPKAWSLIPKLHRHLDLIGFFLLAPATLQLILALRFGGVNYPWNSSQVIGLFVGAFATGVAWVFWN